MHRCADIHAMSELTGKYKKSSEQHVDMSKSRIKRDNDFATAQDWFDLHEPFDESKPCLKSLSSGLDGDELNCDDAEMVGLAIQRSLDAMCMEDVNFRDDVEKLSFELTPELTSLFKQGMMRKLTKANLRNHLIESENCIIDGRMLLHKVYWPKSTFSEVLDQYISYLRRRCASVMCI